MSYVSHLGGSSHYNREKLLLWAGSILASVHSTVLRPVGVWFMSATKHIPNNIYLSLNMYMTIVI